MPNGLSYKPISGKAFTEAVISNYANSQKNAKRENELAEINRRRRLDESSRIYEIGMQRDNLATRRESFIESLKTNFLCESIFKIFNEAVRDDLKKDPAARTIMRCMVNSFVQENDTNSIIRKMRNGSNLLSEIHNLITSHTKAILEDSDNNGEMIITQDMKDDFFNALDYTDAESISERIKERVATAVADFVDNNAKEHEEIQNILATAAEKIEKLPSSGDEEKDQAVAESYNQIAKGNANTIRNRRKNVFHSLVTAMAEQVIRNKDMQAEFMYEGKLDMNKIVNRVELMYTFMETVNSIKLINIDETFIEETIAEMKK